MGKIWVKHSVNLRNDRRMSLVRSTDVGPIAALIYYMLMELAGEQDNKGLVSLTVTVPYTVEMLAAEFRINDVAQVERALEVLSQFGMIYRDDAGVIAIADWEETQANLLKEAANEYDAERKRGSKGKGKNSRTEAETKENIAISPEAAAYIDSILG